MDVLPMCAQRSSVDIRTHADWKEAGRSAFCVIVCNDCVLLTMDDKGGSLCILLGNTSTKKHVYRQTAVDMCLETIDFRDHWLCSHTFFANSKGANGETEKAIFNRTVKVLIPLICTSHWEELLFTFHNFLPQQLRFIRGNGCGKHLLLSVVLGYWPW